tara:strand:- start:715 stop:2262 length:1548 start_codon:yes stop_codon:yes gene_type:complete
MKKQNLTEEIYRMRKLMNFDSKEFNENTTSEDQLIEESYVKKYVSEDTLDLDILVEDSPRDRRRRNRKFKKRAKKSTKKYKKQDKKANRLIKFQKGSEFDVDISKNYNRYRNIGITLSKGKGEEVEFDGEYETDGIGDTDRFDIENFDPNDITGENWIEIIKRSDLYQDVSKMMIKLMSDGSKVSWNKLLNDPEHVMYGVEAMDRFNESYKKLNGKTKWKSVYVGDSEERKYEERTISVEPEEIPDILVPITWPIDQEPTADFFEDNKFQVTEVFAAEVEVLLDRIRKEMKNMEDPKMWLTYINVETSSSRLRNGTAKTWLQLSEERNNEALNYTLNNLKNIGVDTEGAEKTQNWKGTNGDGSSGPNPPLPFAFNSDGSNTWRCSTKDGPGKRKCPENERTSKGKVLGAGESKSSIRDYYDEYKKVTMDLGIKVKGQQVGSNKEQPKEKQIIVPVDAQIYDIEFVAPPKGIQTGIGWFKPQILITTKKRKKNSNSGPSVQFCKPQKQGCAAYGNN